MKIFFTFIAKIKLYDPLEQFDTSGADKALASFYSYFSIPETTDQITANITVSLFILLLISYYVNFKKQI